jgi:ferric-dicitrate binding protein FerR (iron transport regulator)
LPAAYTVEELLTDDTFLAYVLGTDPAAVRQWEDRLRRQPQHALVVGEARRLIRLLAIKPEPLAGATLEEEVQRLESRLAAAPVRPIAQGRPQERPGRVPTFWLRAAASLLFLLVSAVLAWTLLLKPTRWLTCRTAAGESKLVVLPDSSVVFLSGGSTLRYPRHWHNQGHREVWLQGDAFFHVRPKAVPGGLKFRVHAAGTTVEVLGTRFNVWNKGRQVRVVLNEGKVKVNVGKGQQRQPVFLEPGEMVEVPANRRQVRKSRVALAAHPAQKENKIVFEDAPVRRIALVVKEYYGLQVRLQDSAIADLRISGTLPTNNEERFFKALAIILDLKITKGPDKQVTFQRNH